MDLQGTKLLGVLAVVGICFSVTALATEKFQLREMAWLSSESQVEALTTIPITRVNISEITNQKIQTFLVGQTLFHTPSLLGGQAAKAGISCASCHTNGRTNPHFLFPGVSDKPGTADVTHSFFSSHRGDGKFNPVPIPDLTKPGKISRNKQNQDLENFVRDLIVEEFDGQEPSKKSLTALSTYIRSLAAPVDEGETIKLSEIEIEQQLDLAGDAIASAKIILNHDDYELAKLLIAGSRHKIGQIHQRFPGEALQSDRKLLEKLGYELGKIQNMTTENKEQTLALIDQWQLDFSQARETLGGKAEQSLYNPEILEKFLNQ